MESRPAAEGSLRLDRGRASPLEILTGLWWAITSRNPVADWARCRVLAMLITVVVLGWGLGRAAGLALAGPGAEPAGLPAGDLAASEAGGASIAGGRAAAGQQLRTDLFKVPRLRKPGPPPAPKTNPVELLALIELQGILGGSRPRAMIQYKRTQEAVTVSVGDDLGEFKVMEIRERSVVLKWRDELFELSL